MQTPATRSIRTKRSFHSLLLLAAFTVPSSCAFLPPQPVPSPRTTTASEPTSSLKAAALGDLHGGNKADVKIQREVANFQTLLLNAREFAASKDGNNLSVGSIFTAQHYLHDILDYQARHPSSTEVSSTEYQNQDEVVEVVARLRDKIRRIKHKHELLWGRLRLHMEIEEATSETASALVGISILLCATHAVLYLVVEEEALVACRWAAANAYLVTLLRHFATRHPTN
jgi:hypothetical protein